MTREELYDAMNLIADDLIEEVHTLRIRRKRRARIVRYLSVAACICLIAGSVFVWGDIRPETAKDGAIKEDVLDTGTTVQIPKVTLKVKELLEDGFVGSVVEDSAFTEGTELTVCVLQGEYVEYTVGSIVNVEYRQDVAGDTTTELEDLNKDEVADKSFSESATQDRIYAEKITLIEGGEK